jgi:hypothetical protein
MHRLHLKFVKKGQMSWDAELQRKSRKMSEGCCARKEKLGILVNVREVRNSLTWN